MDRFLSKGIKTCFITRGVPGSGKTTIAINLKAKLELSGYSVEIAAADDYFPDGYNVEGLSYAHMSCTRKLVNAMKSGIDAVIQHNTNVKEWESQALRSNVITLYLLYNSRHKRWVTWCIILKGNMHSWINH